MIENSVKPTAIEAVKERIASTLQHLDRKIAGMTEKMNADYFHFFVWYAEDMYTAQKIRNFLALLAEEMERREDNEGLSEWLLAMAARKSSDIARGSLSRNSTNVMDNRAYLLSLEAEQQLVIEIEGLAFVAQHYNA